MTDDRARRRLRRRRSAEPEPDSRPDSAPDSRPDSGADEHDHPVPKPPDPAHKPAPPAENTTPAQPGANAKPVEKTHAPRADKSERSLRGLVGSGPSQVGVSAAMRARDAARPDADDIAAAERDLAIVRRHYEPHDSGPKPKNGKR